MINTSSIKRFILTLFLTGAFLPVFAQSVSDTLVVEAAYDHSKNAPIAIDSGTVVISHAHKLYLVNQLRYDFYEALRSIVRDSIDNTIEGIVLKYEKILTENNVLFDELEQKCKEQSLLYEKSTKHIKASLTGLEGTLDLTQKSLQNANKTLGYATEQLSESKKSRFWNKFGLLGGGIGIGLLTGLLLIK